MPDSTNKRMGTFESIYLLTLESKKSSVILSSSQRQASWQSGNPKFGDLVTWTLCKSSISDCNWVFLN